jgi:hypothetical protein
LPAGTYLVSHTIENGFAHVHQAGTAAIGSRYSVIRLCHHADKFQDATAARPVLWTLSGSATNRESWPMA